MARSEEAAERGKRLRAAMEEDLDALQEAAKVEPPDDEKTQSWEHIPAEQILVVEVEGKTQGAVSVDTPDGRALYSQERSPCPTCGQDWTRGTRLEGEVKILWPDHYKT